jgi:two-component system chemotaxis response regulator CheB
MAGVVVIGASQGGVQALRSVIGGLKADFAFPIVVVVHIGASESILPLLLNDMGTLPSSHAQSGDKLIPGHIYVAPPDHHLLVVDGELELTRGPRENWARPSIDPLFRSAAEVYGPAAIGVVLTGGLNDGTAGLYEIKRRGGIAIVQDPAEAEVASMPKSALQNVKVDFVLPVGEIPKILIQLAAKINAEAAPSHSGTTAMNQSHTSMQPIAQTCPECGGAMREEKVGSLTRFRCHIGHVMTGEVLVSNQLVTMQNELESVLRSLNERAHLCRDIARSHESAGRAALAEIWRHAADEADEREKAMRTFAESKWIHPEATLKENGGQS